MIENIKEYIKERQTLFTIFAVVIIVLGGTQVINNPGSWWVAPVFVLCVLATILMFMHARAILKFFLSIFILMLSIYFSVPMGNLADTITGMGGIIFSSSLLSMYALCIAVSYLTSSLKSRWTSGSLATITHVFVSFMVMDIFYDHPNVLIIGVVSGFIAGLFIFFFRQLFKINRVLHSGHYPSNIASDILTDNIKEAFEKEGWNFRDLRRKGNKGGYLVWKDQAYYLYPVRLMQDFTEWKKTELRYNNKNINPWLSSIAQKRIPVFRSRNTPIMPILLDLTNANGSKGKVIGTFLPDSKAVVPFGIFPCRELNSNRKNKSGIIKNFENRFKAFTNEITAKNDKHLSKIGVRKEQETEEESETENHTTSK